MLGNLSEFLRNVSSLLAFLQHAEQMMISEGRGRGEMGEGRRGREKGVTWDYN